MKQSVFTFLLFLLLPMFLSAQEPIFLFGDYQPATFRMKRNITTKARINIDAKYQKIYFLQGEDVMELTNCEDIDTLFVDSRKFVWKNDCLCEYVKVPYGVIYVNWRIRDSFVGKVGAFGTTTQQKVEVMQVPGINSEYSYDSIGKYEDRTDVWTVKNENIYFLEYEGIEYKVHHYSELYRYFPRKAADIKRFFREHNYTMKSAEEARKIFDFICTGADE